MPGCTFNISGENFNVDGFLATVDWEIDFIHRKGEIIKRRPGYSYEDSGFGMTVSDSDGFLCEELEDVERFLDNNISYIETLRTKFMAEEMSFDFGYYCILYKSDEDIVWFSQGESIEPSLLKKCGDLGIRIDLSLYPWPDESPKRRGGA